MAPEQASERMVDRRIDLYNFGATMYRMFTGRYAQQGILIPDEVRFRTLVPPIAIKGSDDEDDESLPDGCVKRTNLLGRQGIDA